MRDVDYFSKDNMEKKSCRAFLNYLPSNLREKLEKAMTASEHIKRGSLSVLKAYDTYSPYNGVKKITCKWDATAKMNFIPIAGWIVYGTAMVMATPNCFDIF